MSASPGCHQTGVRAHIHATHQLTLSQIKKASMHALRSKPMASSLQHQSEGRRGRGDVVPPYHRQGSLPCRPGKAALALLAA